MPESGFVYRWYDHHVSFDAETELDELLKRGPSTSKLFAFEGDDYPGFIRNKYFRWYAAILLKAYERGPIPKPFARHHPWPRSIPGGTKRFGFVTITLTPREHVDAHWLLTKFTSGRDLYKMQVTMERMCTGKNGKKLKPCQVAAAMKAAKEKRHPAETKRKISAARLLEGRYSPERCSAIAAGQRGRKHTPETRAKMSAWHRTPEYRAKIGATLRGRTRSPEHCAALRKPKSLETRAKLSVACSGWKHTPESRAKIATSSRGRKYGPRSPETRAKLSAAQRRRYADGRGRKLGPFSSEHRAKLSAAARRRYARAKAA